MKYAQSLISSKKIDEAALVYDECANRAPAEDYRADALFYRAAMYETAMRRWDATAAYKRLTTECPNMPGYACSAYGILGALYSDELCLPGDAPESDVKRARAEMSPEEGVRYAELAMNVAPRDTTSYWGAKYALAVRYAGANRMEDAKRLLFELDKADLYEVKKPRQLGRFQWNTTYFWMPSAVQIDGARVDAGGIRHGARMMLVNFATSAPDTRNADLQALIDRDPQGELGRLAREELARVTAQPQEQ
jgi:tetratricopeptide (TPR) repeat protein